MEENKDLIWAATKLVEIRTSFGNAPFTTNDLERLFKILGSERFIAATEPRPKREGVYSPY